jgi:glycosyltransferase involved in cell wall biosynthesis
MKILILSESDISGGAARAAYRLHQSLLSQGVDSQILVQRKSSDDFTVLTKDKKSAKYFNRLRPIIDSIPNRFYKNRTGALFSSSWLGFSGIADKINELNPDIVHLHWIAGGMLRIEEISKIKAPIVWSLHDMWPFSGGCHYDQHCGLYKGKCGTCKVLSSKKENDLSRKVFNRKASAYSKIRMMNIVATSRWIGKCAKESFLLKDRNVVTLPNPLNTSIFSQIDKNIARGFFNIPKDKTIILFGAMRSILDSRKGSKELFEAINMLDLEDVVFVIAGSSKPQDPPKLKYPTYFIPPLNDEVSLPLIYNVADVMIVPSIQENLANSIIESLSCGVPVVAFDIGGNSDMIEHKRNGYLAKAIIPKDMAIGIEWVLKNNESQDLSNNARNKAVKEFGQKVVSKKYIDLYKSILEE